MGCAKIKIEMIREGQKRVGDERNLLERPGAAEKKEKKNRGPPS